MPAFIQASFAKGELSPALHGRVDVAAYQIALRTARNCIVHAQGGISNRAGLAFIGPQRDHTRGARHIEFQFKTTDNYDLIFEDATMRVIRDDAYVCDTNTAITAATKANPGVITSAGHGLTTGDDFYIDEVQGMTRLNGRVFRANVLTADTFQLKDQVTGANVDTTAYGTYTTGGTVRRIYTKASPYAYADLAELKYVQSADVMTLTNNGYPPYELSRIAHDNWVFAVPTFAPSVDYPVGNTVVVTTAGTTTERYRVTAIDEDGKESLPALCNDPKTITAITKANPAQVTSAGHLYDDGDEVQIDGVVGMTELNGRRFAARNCATDTFELLDEDSTTYTAYASGGTATATFVKVTTSADTPATAIKNEISWDDNGAFKFGVYREDGGIYGLIGQTERLTFTDDNIAPDTTQSPPRARNPFRIAGQYPGAVSYFEQRRVFGGSIDRPDTEDFSRTSDQSNFSRSSPAQSDDAITATLAAREVNEIRHFVPGNDLIVLTSGGEWRVNSGQDAAFEAATLRQKPQSYWGSSHRRPLVLGNSTLFVQENDSVVRSIGYSFQIDGYTGNDLTVTASHLFRDYAIVDWAFAAIPDPIVTMVRADGTLAFLTFNTEQEMVAWSRGDTQGKFEAVSSLKHPSGEIDSQPYFSVKRRVNGHDVRYIERMHSRRFTDVRDCFFVDSGLSYDLPIAITGVTTANPIVVTATAHGLSNGDPIDFSGILWEPQFDSLDNETQPAQLNNFRLYVKNKTADTFQIATSASGAAINSTDTTLFEDGFADYVGGGYVRKAVDTVSGLDHLEGCDVVGLADGNYFEATVANGAITLAQEASRIHVGLKYISDVETLNMESPQGTVQGRLKRIIEAVVRFDRSRGLFMGPDSNSLVEIKQREDENMGDPTDLLTGDKGVVFNSDWDTNGRIFMRQRYPLPMTILAVVPTKFEGEDPLG
jgi:hypothetical protein